MNKIQNYFNERFANWGIGFPPDTIENRRRGKIVKASWAICYFFGSDEKGEYLDYYVSHRMTSDSHQRIYVYGCREGLPAIQTYRI